MMPTRQPKTGHQFSVVKGQLSARLTFCSSYGAPAECYITQRPQPQHLCLCLSTTSDQVDTSHSTPSQVKFAPSHSHSHWPRVLDWQRKLLVVAPGLDVVVEKVGVRGRLDQARNPRCAQHACQLAQDGAAEG